MLWRLTQNPKLTPSRIKIAAPTETSTLKYPKIVPLENEVIRSISMEKSDNWLIESSTFKNSCNHKIPKNYLPSAGKNLTKLLTILKSHTKNKWPKWKMTLKSGSSLISTLSTKDTAIWPKFNWKSKKSKIFWEERPIMKEWKRASPFCKARSLR